MPAPATPVATGAPALAVEGLVIRFPGLPDPVLDIPALAIAPGERVAVTGPSGSGKSTLVNALTGLAKVREGHVRWESIDLAALGEGRRDDWRARHVGLVMQDFHLFPGLSAIENVLLPVRLRRALDADLRRRAGDLLARVGLARPGQAVETLSRGEMQRVAVARALLRRPGILVADEPSASLDAASGAAVAELILELSREEGATLIVVSHDERIVGRLERRLRLIRGRLGDAESDAT
ncbi:ABC transporter ATP-binding protein [Ancylobacter terrae]|uniref:ABC transporter ATP-binding protein n=1 Tax=Ancylobacter sp. sgz301288 TaxID=3342077 RepID=UPI00385A9B18